MLQLELPCGSESDLDLRAVGGRAFFVWISTCIRFFFGDFVFPPERFLGFSHWLPADGSSAVLDLVFSFAGLLEDACFKIVHRHNFAVMRSFFLPTLVHKDGVANWIIA